MSRRGNADQRCALCRMHESLCVCSLIPKIATKTRLLLFIHRYEDRKSTNTGRLATRCLSNSEVFVRGHETQPSPPFVWDPESVPLFLFPHDGAEPITNYAATAKARPVTLIVPDGTWRQAFKVRNRVPGMREVPCVSLPPGAPTIYRLRAESHDAGLATMEAIARAMGVLEGPEVQQSLELVFRAMVERTLWSRGDVDAKDVTLGIPKGAMRHDPRSGPARDSSA